MVSKLGRCITLRNVEEAIQVPHPLPFLSCPALYLHRLKVLPLSEVPTFDHYTKLMHYTKLALMKGTESSFFLFS